MALTKVTGDFIKAGSITQGHLHSSHGITTSHIAEGDKLFFTNARVANYLSSNNYVSGTGTNNRLAIWNGTGVIDSDSDFYVDGDTIYTTNLEASGNLNITGTSVFNNTLYVAEYIQHLGNTGNNIRFTTDAIAISANATFSSSVGIGVSPTAKLHIQGTNSANGAIKIHNSGGNPYAIYSDNNDLLFTNGNGSSTALTIAYSGNATFAGDLTVSGGDITLGGTGRIQGIDTVSANTDAANKLYVDNQVAGIVDSAPSTLDTLNELAAALGDDANFSTTVTNSIATKLPLAGGTLTGNLTLDDGAGASPYLILKNSNDETWNIFHGSQGILNFAEGSDNRLRLLQGGNATFAGSVTIDGDLTVSGNNVRSKIFESHVGHPYLDSDGTNNYIKGGNSGANNLYGEYNQFRSGGAIIPNATTTYDLGLSGNVWNNFYANTAYASILYDRDNSGYYLNPASWSYIYGFSNEVRYGGASYSDPDPGVSRDAKFGNAGIAATSGKFTGDVTAPSFIGKLMGGANGAPDATIWCISGSYTDWGIFYDENTPDVIQFKSSGNVKATISLDHGDYTGRNATFSGTISASGYNNSNWDTAYGWGNHASAGYFTNSGSWLGDLGSYSYTREHGIQMTGGSEFVILSKSGQGSVLIDGHYMSYEAANGFFGSYNSAYGNLTGIRASAANTLKVMQLDGGNAILEVTQDVRAPLYYDLNNTTYYVNPATSSLLKAVQIDTTSNSAGSAFKIYTTTNHQYPQIYSNGTLEAMWNYKNNAAEWYVGIRTSSQLLGTSGFHFYNTTSSQTVGGWDINGHSYSIGSSRAPIFYDSNDTAFYLNPASTSIVNILKAGVTGGAWGSVKIATSTDAGWGTGGSYPFIGSGPGSTGSIVMLHNPHIPFRTENARNGASGRAGIRCAINTSASGWWDIGLYGDAFEIWRNASSTQIFLADSGGNTQSATSSRAPIFYDSNDTSYYVNPNSDSVMNQIHLNDYIRHNGDLDTYMGFNGADSWKLHVGGGDRLIVNVNQISSNLNLIMNNKEINYVHQLHFNDGVRFYDDGNNNYLNFKWNNGNNGGIKFIDGGGALQGYIYGSGNGEFGILDKDGHWTLITNGASYTALRSNNNEELVVYNDRVEVAADLRSPIFYDKDSTAHYIHPGNLSNLSGLNVQYGNQDLRYSNTVDMTGSSYNQSTYYPVRIYVSDITRIRIENRLNAGGTHPSWATHGSGFSLVMDWYTNGSGWGTVGVARTIRQWNEAWANVTICGGITQMTNSSAEVVWLRGGGKYLIKTSFNNTVQVSSSSHTGNSQTVTPTTSIVNDVWSSSSGGFSAGNIYGHKFWDAGDANYFLNPADTGVSLKVKGTAEFVTAAGNLRGYIRATDTNDSHFIIATSGGEDIAFKDGGTSGNVNMIIRGDGDVLTFGNNYGRIWYDYDNSAYYINPASTSNLNAATFAGNVVGQNAYFGQDVGIGFTSGSIGGNLNIRNSAAGQTAAKIELGSSSNGSTIGAFIHTGASYASSGMFLNFQSNHISGDDNVLICYLDGDLVNKNNSYTQYSDERLKENIVDATPKLNEIKQIKVRNFNFKGEDLKQIGIVAQELEPIFPALVKEREVPGHEDLVKTVKYSVLVPILIKAMQEQQTIIDDLKSRLETLENQ